MDLTKKSSYNYHLPKELIAQHPQAKRDQCKLLHLDRTGGDIRHKSFREIITLLQPTDVLVINTTKVIPARLFGCKKTGAKVEVLLLRDVTGAEENHQAVSRWECLVKPGNKLHLQDEIVFFGEDGAEVLQGVIVFRGEEGVREIEFRTKDSQPFLGVIENIGKVPLPPYIKRDYSQPSDSEAVQEDKLYYQTVYAEVPGSAAAPTAGMHFTPQILEEIAAKGVKIVPVVLHIGIDTFRPVKVENILEHKMHREFCSVPQETATVINEAKQNKHRIIAVGTTVTRTLESFAGDETKVLEAGSKWSDLFIYPGYKYRIIDGLLTNFHLPESSLLMLVSAFGGYERVIKAYQEAVAQEYRFFSYGDAMLII